MPFASCFDCLNLPLVVCCEPPHLPTMPWPDNYAGDVHLFPAKTIAPCTTWDQQCSHFRQQDQTKHHANWQSNWLTRKKWKPKKHQMIINNELTIHSAAPPRISMCVGVITLFFYNIQVLFPHHLSSHDDKNPQCNTTKLVGLYFLILLNEHKKYIYMYVHLLTKISSSLSLWTNVKHFFFKHIYIIIYLMFLKTKKIDVCWQDWRRFWIASFSWNLTSHKLHWVTSGWDVLVIRCDCWSNVTSTTD